MTNPFFVAFERGGGGGTNTGFPDLVGIHLGGTSGVDHLWNAGVCSVESRSQSGEHTL